MNPYTMGGWGKGLQGAGDALMQLAQYYETRDRNKAEQERLKRAEQVAEEERKRRQTEADRLYNQNLEKMKFELGLEEAEPLERRTRGPALVDIANATAMPDGWKGAPMTIDRGPLEEMALDAAKRLGGARSINLTDASGRTARYIQPRERTAEGKADAARTRFFQSLEGKGYTPEQVSQLQALYDAPEGLAKEVLGIIRPPEPEKMTPYQQAQIDLQRDRLNYDRTRQGTGGGAGTGRPPARPTEAQEKSFLFYNTMSKSLDEMTSITNDPDTKVRGWAIQAALGAPLGVGNVVLTPAEQTYLRAARDFTSGMLRKESGAAIRDYEVLDMFARYIPAPWDSEQVKKAKADARAARTADMQKLATPAMRYYQWSETSGQEGTDPTMDELIDFFMNGGRN